MKFPLIAVKTKSNDVNGNIDLGNGVYTGILDNPNFTTVNPAPATLLTKINLVVAAKAKHGSKSNHGTSADLADLRTKTLDLWITIKSIAESVQNISQVTANSDYELMAALILTSGFQLKGTPNPQGLLQKVESFRVVLSKQLFPNQVMMKWKKPLNVTSKGNVKGYKVCKGVQPPVFSTAAVYATVTKGSFVDTNNTGDAETWSYWIVPFNTAGDGAPSEPITVTVLSN